MHIRLCRRTLARLAVVLALAMPLAASASDTLIERLVQSDAQERGFEDCAASCQVRVDQQIAQCPGFREVANPAMAATAAAPRCKQTAVEQYQSCLSRCPSPPNPPQG